MGSLPNWTQGSTHTGLRLRWVRKDGTYPDLTGATITGKLRSITPDSSSVAMTGTLVPDTSAASSGYFTYAPSTADVNTPGSYKVQFRAAFSDGKSDSTYQTDWTIEAVL